VLFLVYPESNKSYLCDGWKVPPQSSAPVRGPTKNVHLASQHNECNVKNTMQRLYRGVRNLGNTGHSQLLRVMPRRGHRPQGGGAACGEGCPYTQHALNPEMEATTCM